MEKTVNSLWSLRFIKNCNFYNKNHARILLAFFSFLLSSGLPTIPVQLKCPLLWLQKDYISADCALCLHSDNATRHSCCLTGDTYPITNSITCTDNNVIYKVTLVKSIASCPTVQPTYIGETGGRARCAQHLGTATQP